MADCEQTLHELERFLDGELDPDLRLAITEHAGGCNACLEKLSFHQELKQVVRQKAREEALPAELLDRLTACLGDLGDSG